MTAACSGITVVRRPDHQGDIVLTDFTDRFACRYTFGQLLKYPLYGPIVLSEPQGRRNEFDFISLRGQVIDLDDTPLRTYLSTFRRVAQRFWADWRCAVFG